MPKVKNLIKKGTTFRNNLLKKLKRLIKWFLHQIEMFSQEGQPARKRTSKILSNSKRFRKKFNKKINKFEAKRKM